MEQKDLFKNVTYKYEIKEIPTNAFPCFIFVSDNWNDYGYRTLFNTYYYESKNKHPIEIGYIKILQKNTKTTKLSCSFNQLTNDYCSLGSSNNFYKKLFDINREIALDFLTKMNDIAINDKIYDSFKDEEGFQVSLLRSASSEFNLATVRQLITGTSPLYNHNFVFKYNLPNVNGPHKIQFNFDPIDYDKVLPYRINCIIGKNATGKTLLLSNLYKFLRGKNNNEVLRVFPNGRPQFSKTIAVSFSLFDTFYRAEMKEENSSQDINFHYCGFHHPDGRLLTDKQITTDFLKALDIIKKDADKKQLWIELLEKADKYINTDELLLVKKEFIKDYGFSSGQNILLLFITHIIAYIEDKSLILFDEPELHLHPNAISKMITLIHDLLNKKDSFAIISTHSPIIVQQIPSQYIRVINRLDNIPDIFSPNCETFGENLSAIDRDIFSNIDFDLFYKNNLKSLKEHYPNTEYIENSIFNGNLPFNACLFLENIENENK